MPKKKYDAADAAAVSARLKDPNGIWISSPDGSGGSYSRVTPAPFLTQPAGQYISSPDGSGAAYSRNAPEPSVITQPDPTVETVSGGIDPNIYKIDRQADMDPEAKLDRADRDLAEGRISREEWEHQTGAKIPGSIGGAPMQTQASQGRVTTYDDQGNQVAEKKFDSKGGEIKEAGKEAEKSAESPEATAGQSQSPQQGSSQGGSVATGPRRIKGHWEDDRDPLRPETQAGLMENVDQKKNIAGEATLHRAIENQLVADQMVLDDQEARKKIDENAANQSRRDLDIDTKQKAMDDIAGDLRKMEMDKRSYLERNPLSGIALAIGAALGGALAARTGGPNQGLQTLENAINRDISLQKYAIEKKRGDLDAANGVLARTMRVSQSKQEAEDRALALMKGAAADRIRSMVQGFKSVEERDRGMALANTLDEEKLKLLARHDMATHVAPQVVGGGNPGGYEQLDAKRYIDLGNGQGVYAKDEESRRTMDTNRQKRAQIVEAIDQWKTLREQYNKESNLLSPIEQEKRLEQMKGLQGRIIGAASQMSGSGTPTGKDQENIEAAFGNATKRFDPTGSAITGLDMARNAYVNAGERELGGLPVVNRKFGRDAKGSMREFGSMTGQVYQGPGTFTLKK